MEETNSSSPEETDSGSRASDLECQDLKASHSANPPNVLPIVEYHTNCK